MRLFKFSFVLLVAMVTAGSLFGQSLVFDRGLPTANLNNAAGANRSNVAWAFDGDYITGDDFSFGTVGEKWLITKNPWMEHSGYAQGRSWVTDFRA
ncbi:MAG: hypothetical protein IPG58_02350 [Acidobacteria bacterium]|nr:hypothetical protein [Acidobacteriota bacterium]